MYIRFIKIALICLCYVFLVTKIQGQSTHLLPSNEAMKLETYLELAAKNKKERNLSQVASYYNKIAYLYWDNKQSYDALRFFEKSLDINLELGNINEVKAIQNNIGMILAKGKIIDSLAISQQKNQIKNFWIKLTISISAGIIITILLIIIFVLNRKLKTQKKKLFESENKFRILFEESDDPFVIISDNKFVDCNDALIKLLGFTTKKKFLEHTPVSLAAEWQDDKHTSEELFEKATTDAYRNGYARAEWVVKKVNGSALFIDASYTVIEIQNKTYLYAIWRDISRQKKAEIELTDYKDHLEDLIKKRTYELQVAKEKAEDSNRIKTVFIRKVTQKINTPLNAIINISKMLIGKTSRSDFEKIADRLELIHNSGNELMKMNESILKFSKLESGLVNLKYTLINIKKFMYKIESHTLNLIDKKPVEYTYTINENFPATIYSDLDLLTLIIETVIENSVKYTDKGYIRFGVDLEDNWYNFNIEDSGIGMEKKLIKDIMDNSFLFSYLQNKDFGFGLLLCKKSIELLNGEIKIESSPSKGTKVKIMIPRMRY